MVLTSARAGTDFPSSAPDAQAIAQALVKEALFQSKDNITCIVVLFNWEKQANLKDNNSVSEELAEEEARLSMLVKDK